MRNGLTDTAARKAKAADKPYKLVDGNGLHLYVSPSGSKVWRWRYKIGGKEKLLTIGRYPEMTLQAAREHRDAADKARRSGRDPAAVKRIEKPKAGETFEVIAREWFKLNKTRWASRHADDVGASLEWAYPSLGALSIRAITPADVLTFLREVEERPAIETAKRLRQRISAIYTYAIATGRADADPAAGLAPALAPLIKGRRPAVTTIKEAREVLAVVDATPSLLLTRLAHRLLALTAIRPGELRYARWEDIDGDMWRVPSSQMKMRREHWVPLSDRALETLAAARRMTGNGPLVFPSLRHIEKPMSANALGYLLGRAGFKGRHVPHGWRATFSTIMNEQFPSDRHVIDLMLAHWSGGGVERSYNRAEHLERRREIAQLWADLLFDGLPPASALFAGMR